MQINRALDALDKKEETLEAVYFGGTFAKQAGDG